MKKLITLIMITVLAYTASAQCSAPVVRDQYRQGKNYCFELDCYKVYKAEWSADGITWQGHNGNLSTSCLTYGHGANQRQIVRICVTATQNLPAGYPFNGIQDGWQVRFYVKCPNGTWSSPTQGYTVQLH